ncbi:MAG: acyl-CoA thioesterase II [Acidimicrobiia bacterium]|nr:acyl-CoA thioesterase II [Acidimicrobiia bacterium]
MSGANGPSGPERAGAGGANGPSGPERAGAGGASGPERAGAGTAAFEALLEVLAVEPLGEDRFRGLPSAPTGPAGNLYGGHLLGQCLAAMCRTVPADRPVHSLHAYFLRPGDAGTDLVHEVHRTRDGRSFSHRRAVAVQHGQAVFEMTASFHRGEPGPDFHQPMPDDVVPPEALPGFAELMASHATPPFDGYWMDLPRPLDLRYVDAPWTTTGPTAARGIRVWLRSFGPLPEDPHLHACVLAYGADESISDNVLVPHGVRWTDEGLDVASLDHSMWFHQPFRCDDWLLVVQEPVATAAARGLATGRVWDRHGRLVATMAQEALMRI